MRGGFYGRNINRRSVLGVEELIRRLTALIGLCFGVGYPLFCSCVYFLVDALHPLCKFYPSKEQ